jgi:hypothetical protein
MLFLLLIVDLEKFRELPVCAQWHNVSTKFRSNRSAGLQFQMEETGPHSQRKTYT